MHGGQIELASAARVKAPASPSSFTAFAEEVDPREPRGRSRLLPRG